MQYNEKDKDFVFQISSSKLFRKCKDANIPFHNWYNWIEGELIQIDKEMNPKHRMASTPRHEPKPNFFKEE
jgi:hypothetical protein